MSDADRGYLNVHSAFRLGWLIVLLPIAHFLAPKRILEVGHLDSWITQAVLCSAAGVYLTARILLCSKKQDYYSMVKSCGAGLLLTLAYLGALEMAQLLSSDRHARVADFERNAVAAMLSITLYAAFAAGLLFLIRAEEKKREEPFS